MQRQFVWSRHHLFSSRNVLLGCGAVPLPLLRAVVTWIFGRQLATVISNESPSQEI